MKGKQKFFVPVLFLIYLALLVWIILFKLQFNINDLDTVRSINLIPFYYDKEIGTSFHLKEVFENLLIFVPMGIYLQMLLPKCWFHGKLIIIAGTSILLEVAQYVLAIGRSDITDLITNFMGGLLGLALYGTMARLLKNRDTADKLFFILAVIVSVVVVGFLAFILFLNDRRCAILNKRTTTEKRLSVHLYLSLVLYTVVGFGLVILLDYIFSKFNNMYLIVALFAY